jgi:hypothetical protein
LLKLLLDALTVKIHLVDGCADLLAAQTKFYTGLEHLLFGSGDSDIICQRLHGDGKLFWEAGS